MALVKIAVGDKVACLKCGKEIEVNTYTLIVNGDGEYIRCPRCGRCDDVQSYHKFGTQTAREDAGETSFDWYGFIRDHRELIEDSVPAVMTAVYKEGLKEGIKIGTKKTANRIRVEYMAKDIGIDEVYAIVNDLRGMRE